MDKRMTVSSEVGYLKKKKSNGNSEIENYSIKLITLEEENTFN
jgi:hypothetical protein